MMRAKLVKARREGIRFREKILGDPDRMGRMSTGRAAAFANWANRRPLLRRPPGNIALIFRIPPAIEKKRLNGPFVCEVFQKIADKRHRAIFGNH